MCIKTDKVGHICMKISPANSSLLHLIIQRLEARLYTASILTLLKLCYFIHPVFVCVLVACVSVLVFLLVA